MEARTASAAVVVRGSRSKRGVPRELPPGSPDGPQGAVDVGNDFIEWKIPLKDLQYQAFPMFPVAGKVDKGIDNRYIHLYAHPQGSTPSDSVGTVPWDKPLIIRFYE